MNHFFPLYTHKARFILFSCFFLTASLLVNAQDRVTSEVAAADGTKLHYIVEGSGDPCVVVNGSNYQRVYSKGLRQHLKLIFLDFRHGSESDMAAKVDDITLDTLVDDIEQVRKALGSDRIAVMGHSLPSLIALEYARKYPENTSHVILTGAPPFMIPPKEREAFWGADASEARKLAEKRNQERITDEDLKKASPGKAWALQYVRNGARYWYDPSYDSSWMREGRAPNINFMRHVAGLLRDYDVGRRTPRVTTPVFLALGRYDYGVPYHVWDGRKDSFPQLSYNLFEKSGHYPMLEEQSLFDRKLTQWMRKK